jgi:hypothetical protein
MRKIILGAQVSKDGVMQAPGGQWEDPTKGFKFGKWVMPYFNPVFGEEIDRVFKETCDLLLGCKTYEIVRRILAVLRRNRPARLLNAPQLPRAVPVFEPAARRTVEIVPLFRMLDTDAAKVAVHEHERPIAGWAHQRRG